MGPNRQIPLWAQSRLFLHGWERVITNGIKTNRQPWYGDLFGPVEGICLFSPTMRMLCLYRGCS